MLPLRHNDVTKGPRGPLGRMVSKVGGWIRLIMADSNSRNLLGFLLLNLSFAFVELFYGVWTNSLGLISDSFHMFFDCTGLMAGLVASVITKWRANEKFSYGYVRAEVSIFCCLTLIPNLVETAEYLFRLSLYAKPF